MIHGGVAFFDLDNSVLIINRHFARKQHGPAAYFFRNGENSNSLWVIVLSADLAQPASLQQRFTTPCRIFQNTPHDSLVRLSTFNTSTSQLKIKQCMNPIEIKSQPPQNSVRGSDLFLFCLPTSHSRHHGFCSWVAMWLGRRTCSGNWKTTAFRWRVHKWRVHNRHAMAPRPKRQQHDVLCKGHLLNGTTPMKLQAIFPFGEPCASREYIIDLDMKDMPCFALICGVNTALLIKFF